MAARPRLTIEEIVKIDVLRSDKRSLPRICAKIKRSSIVLFNYLNLKSSFSLKGKSGRKSSISAIGK